MSLLVGLVVNMMCLTACGDDDDDSNPLIGTWYVNDDDGDNSEITFFKDGTYVVTSKTQKSGTETERATYKTEGNKLVIIWSDGEVSNWTYSISGNKLTITRPSGRTNVFTRK